MGGQSDKVRSADAIAALAARQYGRVKRQQLLAAGLSARQIDRRLESGVLIATHPGVYAVGHVRDDRWALWSEALLVLGPTALLSATTAAALWRIRYATDPAIHVTVIGTTRRKAPPNVVVHRTRHADGTTRNDLAVTSLARTLRDAGRLVPVAERDEMLHQADQRWRLTPRQIHAVLGRGRPGAAALRHALERRLPSALLTRSRLERRVLQICADTGLPLPLVNQTVAGLEVDLYWPEHRLIAEIDSPGFHGDRTAMRTDRERDTHLRLHGFAPPVRFLDDHVDRRPGYVAETLTALLATGRRSQPT